MPPPLLLLLLLLLMLTTGFVRARLELTYVGGSFEFVLDAPCWTARLTFEAHPPQLVAERSGGGPWTPGPGYAGRVPADAPLLRGVTKNDEGLYVLQCDVRDAVRFSLLVGVPTDVTGEPGRSRTLPAHTVTRGGALDSVRWLRDGTTVAEGEPSSGRATAGAGLGGSLPDDWMLTGNVSLHFQQLNETHEGLYYCVVKDSAGSRVVATARLYVTSGRAPQQESCALCWSLLGITAVVLVGLGVALLLVYRKYRQYALVTEKRPEEDGAAGSAAGKDHVIRLGSAGDKDRRGSLEAKLVKEEESG